MSIYPKTPNFYLDAARGVQVYAQATSAIIFGRNANQNISNQDVWGYGATQAIWVPPTAARLHNIKSSSANDSAVGNGAKSVYISGLDTAFAEQSETVILDGTNNVSTVNSYLMINIMSVATVGSDGYNTGIITATAATDATVTSLINPQQNVAQDAIYQVPASTDGFITNFNAGVNVGTGSKIFVDLMVQPLGAPYASVYQLYLGAGPSNTQIIFPTPIKVTAKSIIKARCISNGNNTDVTASFSIVKLLDNLAQ